VKIAELNLSRGTFEERAIAHITSLPNDEVLTLEELSEVVGLPAPTAVGTLRKLREHGIKAFVRTQDGWRREKWLYGNHKALEALRKLYKTL